MTKENDDFPAELRALAGRMDPEPEALRDVAKALYTWRTVDSELAALTWDSSTDEAALAAVRGAAAPRLLTFEGAGVTLEVQVEQVGPVRRLVGQLTSPRPAQLEVRHANGVTGAELDEIGRFVADDLPAGPVSFRVRMAPAGGEPAVVDTSWELL